MIVIVRTIARKIAIVTIIVIAIGYSDSNCNSKRNLTSNCNGNNIECNSNGQSNIECNCKGYRHNNSNSCSTVIILLVIEREIITFMVLDLVVLARV